MSNQQGLNLLVFRPGRRRARGLDLKRALLESLDGLGKAALGNEALSNAALRDGSYSDAVFVALLRAGELECIAADAGSMQAMPFAELTDALAEALLRRQFPSNFQEFRDAVQGASMPEEAELSAAEGFAYYALHPLAYAEVLDKLPPLLESVFVIGIRSIGTTLSAVTSAAARHRGIKARRITVRPSGHPYDRKTQFSPAESRLIQEAAAEGAEFLVVDEGPGLSGSSFLSVAEALEAAGVPVSRIILLCGHEPNVHALCAPNAVERWKKYRSFAAASGEPRRPAEAMTFIGAGEWRKIFEREAEWPESWTSMERVKYLSPGERPRLFKFAGFGHYGEQVLEREQAVAAAGFGPEPQRESDGFVGYPWLAARPMRAQDISRGVLDRMAEYCAFRAKAFATEVAVPAALEEMAEHNLQQLGVALPVKLKLAKPTVADGRMQPHEWLLTRSGDIFKTDSGSHGDDHFFPGPTDIAWDLAGAIVEWRMETAEAAYFLDRYARASGDRADARVADFVTAYTVFRWAYCRMAAQAMEGTAEHTRLEAAAAGYARLLPVLRAASGL
jgi:hypothetical protein